MATPWFQWMNERKKERWDVRWGRKWDGADREYKNVGESKEKGRWSESRTKWPVWEKTTQSNSRFLFLFPSLHFQWKWFKWIAPAFSCSYFTFRHNWIFLWATKGKLKSQLTKFFTTAKKDRNKKRKNRRIGDYWRNTGVVVLRALLSGWLSSREILPWSGICVARS